MLDKWQTVWVDVGPPAIIESLLVKGSYPSEIGFENVGPPSSFGTRITDEALNRILRWYLERAERLGFPFASARVENIHLTEIRDTSFAVVEIGLELGSPGVIVDLQVEGNTRTTLSTIVRETRVHPGDRYTDGLPATVQHRLLRSQLFSSVPEPNVLDHGSEGVSLLINVTEGTHNSFDGILGYLPGTTTGGSGTVMGLVNVQFGNILGTGRRMSARWYRENQSNQEIDLHYTEPWVANLPVHLTGGIFQRKQDSSFVKERVEGDVQVLLSDEVSIGALFSQSSVVPTAGYGATVSPESKNRSFGVSLRYDTRDRPVNPRYGALYATDYLRGSKSTSAPFLTPAYSEASTERYEFDVQFYYPAGSNQVAAVEMHGKSYSASTMDASDLFLVGGTTTIRGYREGQFRGNRIAWMNLEYRFLTGGESSVFAFVDAGYIALRGDRLIGLTESELSAVGYGLGVLSESPLGVLGVSIAFGKGDAFGDGKLHVRLYNRF